MRDIVFWLSGVALAFLVTAGAFLFLANLATAPSEQPLNPDQARGESGQAYRPERPPACVSSSTFRFAKNLSRYHQQRIRNHRERSWR
jgi:hypothetical protein